MQTHDAYPIGMTVSWPYQSEHGIWVDMESGTSSESCSFQTEQPTHHTHISERESHFSELSSVSYVTAMSKEASPNSMLPLPIAIPQMSKSAGAPFMRRYAQALNRFGISESDFIKFLDSLNQVSAASPPIKVIGIVGGVIGLVSPILAQITYNLIQDVGTVISNSSGKTERFICEANKNLFSPRGLQVKLVTTGALLAITRFPNDKSILSPIDWKSLDTKVAPLHERLLSGLQGYICHTTITDKQNTFQESTIDELNSRQLFRDVDRMNKQSYQRARAHSEVLFKQLKRTKSISKEIKKIETRIDKVNSTAENSANTSDRDSYKMERKKNRRLKKLSDEMSELLLQEEEEKRQKLLKLERKIRQQNKWFENQEVDYVGKLLWVLIEAVP